MGDPQETVGDSAGSRTVFELDSAGAGIFFSNLKWNMNQGESRSHVSSHRVAIGQLSGSYQVAIG